MGCGASTEKEKKNEGKYSKDKSRSGGKGEKEVASSGEDDAENSFDERSSLKVREKDEETDYREVEHMEFDRRSHATPCEEPSAFKSEMRHSYRKLKARVQHGINEDPEQYQDEVDLAVPRFREKDRLRVCRWIDDVVLPAPRRPKRVQEASVSSGSPSVTVGGVDIDMEASMRSTDNILEASCGSPFQSGLTPTNAARSSSTGLGGSSSNRTQQQQQQQQAPNVVPPASVTRRVEQIREREKTAGAGGGGEALPMDFVLTTPEEEAGPGLNTPMHNNLETSTTNRFGASLSATPWSPMAASRTSNRYMELSTTGFSQGSSMSGSQTGPNGEKQGSGAGPRFRANNGNFSFTEEAAFMYGSQTHLTNRRQEGIEGLPPLPTSPVNQSSRNGSQGNLKSGSGSQKHPGSGSPSRTPSLVSGEALVPMHSSSAESQPHTASHVHLSGSAEADGKEGGSAGCIPPLISVSGEGSISIHSKQQLDMTSDATSGGPKLVTETREPSVYSEKV